MRVLRFIGTRPAVALGLLIGPVVVLLVAGLLLLRKDRLAVEAEARELVAAAARKVIFGFVEASLKFRPDRYLSLTNEWPEGTLFLQVVEGQLSFPPTIRTNPQSARFTQELPERHSNLWATAEAAEYQRNDLASALRVWSELLEETLPERVESAVRFQRAVALERSGDTNAAAKEFARLAEVSPDFRLDSGLPISPLATLKILGSEGAAAHCVSNLLAHPTEFTPQFLRLGGGEPFAQANRCWEQHEKARKLFTEIAAKPDSERVFRLGSWWIFRTGSSNIIARSETNVGAIFARVISDSIELPAFAAFEIECSDGTIVGTSTNRALWATVNHPGLPEMYCNAYLANPEMLFARQRQRARAFSGLLIASAACATFGVVQFQRNFRKQQRLNELQSNFVSSVSHELRAPLGSIRLISEALQSGRVVDAEKQREYFNFLVEESRRVSGLIENVLEFSRIEQNRRAFEFQPVDLRDVCLAAAKSVEPIAAERGVKIETELTEERCVRPGDSLALERAVINLLDNAIKHSPPRESVTLGLSRSPRFFAIAVQDRGRGIPLSEQEKIFERFYRLGSELRRETPGVGIGLSIVRHSIEAHGGSVQVVSSPHEGATFTILLPYDGPA
jgi:signal transduction histidine kinase